MNILTCNPDGGAYSYILNGLINAFKQSGANVSRSVGKEVANNFDLYIGCSGWRQRIPKKNSRSGLVGIHVNPFGTKKVGSVDGGPVIDEPKDAIQWVIDQQPDFLYCYCTDTFIPEYYNLWTSKYGIPVLPFPTAADITVYKPHKPDNKFMCDIGWVGGKWPYKAIMLDKYIGQLRNRYKCNIFGWADTWRTGKNIDDADVPKLFASAKICPSVSESHTAKFPIDVPERVFKIPPSGGFTIHTYSPAIGDLFGNSVPVASNFDQWIKIIEEYLYDDKKRSEKQLEQKNLILSKHTYFDRALVIANHIGNKDLIDNIKTSKQRIIDTVF